MHAHFGETGGYLRLVAVWQAMTIAMMAPVVWPWVGAYARVVVAPVGAVRRAALAAVFASGYFAAWLGYSAAAAAAQALASGIGVAAGTPLRAAVLAGAGLYQFAPLKRACLVHCRNPLTWFLRRWHDGPAGGFRLGFGHGIYCVGCCWALMLTMVLAGATSALWMIALAAVAFVEQVVPGGDRLRVPLGIALIAGAIWSAG